MISWGHITPGPRSRLQLQVRVRVRESGPGPVPEPEHLNLIPDGRDLGPENDSAEASFPVSGLPLSELPPQPPTANPSPFIRSIAVQFPFRRARGRL